MTFLKAARYSLVVVGLCLTVLPGLALSQGNPPPELTKKQVQEFVQNQFDKMYKRAADTAAEKLKLGGNIKAFAVVADRKQNIRQVTLDDIDKMPAKVALEIMRRSLAAMVKKGSVGATCLVYTTSNPNKNAEAEHVLVAEMEHIFGPTRAQITPYESVNGKTEFGEPVTAKLAPSLFNYKINPDKVIPDDGDKSNSK